VKIEMAMADIDETDVEAVVEVVRSKRLALGSKNLEFEKLVCEKFGVKHAITVNSGTSALHLIVKALGIGPGDEVMVPSFTFVASVNAILFEGATPVFVDIDPETYNFCVKDAANKITSKTKAMMVVDVFGHPVNWKEINSFAAKHNLKVIDDCCEAIGAKYDGKYSGSFGDAGTFAFYPNKQITTGEGGMIVTNNDELAELCRSYRNQGRGAMSAWLEHDHLGFNYRMDEMSAALGCTQLAKLDRILKDRENVANMYLKELASCPEVKTQVIRENVIMSWFVFVVTLPGNCDRNEVMKSLESYGIPSRAYFSPVHSQKYFQKLGKSECHLPVTMNVSERTIALPFHGMMTGEEVKYVVEKLKARVSKSRSVAA
jgi:perosamine synthetase